MLNSITRLAEAVSNYIDGTQRYLRDRSISVQIGRSCLAVAQALVLLFTSWEALTPSTIGNEEGGPQCIGAGSWSLLCVGPSDANISRAVLICIFATVISGVVPRITAVLHAYASFSIATAIGLPDGGEQVAQIFSVLIIPLTFFLPWTNGWRKNVSRVEPNRPVVTATVSAFWTFIRLQFAFIYLQSGISKFATEDWLNGSAMYYVFRDPSFGATGWLGELALAISMNPIGVALISWGSIAIEVLIGLLLLTGKGPALKVAFGALTALHIGIIAFIGLWSFGIIMISVGFIACLPIGTRKARAHQVSENIADGGMYPSGASAGLADLSTDVRES